MTVLEERLVLRNSCTWAEELRQHVKNLEAECRGLEESLQSSDVEEERKKWRDTTAGYLADLYYFGCGRRIAFRCEELPAEIEVWRTWCEYGKKLQEERDALLHYQQAQTSKKRRKLPPPTEKPEICQDSLEEGLRKLEETKGIKIRRSVTSSAEYARAHKIWADYYNELVTSDSRKTAVRQRTTSPLMSGLLFWGTYLVYSPVKVQAYAVALEMRRDELLTEQKESWRSRAQEWEKKNAAVKGVYSELDRTAHTLKTWQPYAQKLEREITELREAIKQQKINERLQRKAQERMADDTAFHERAHKERLIHTVAEMTAVQQQLETAQTWQPYAHRIEGERDSWKRIAVQWQTYRRGKNSMREPPQTPEDEERREQERQERIARKRAEQEERRRQEKERRDAEARERWKERALREVEQKERRVRDLETQIANLGSRVFNLEYGRGSREGRRNDDKIARLRDKYQGLEERKRRLNDEIIQIQTRLYG